jgi:hypothetical protein
VRPPRFTVRLLFLLSAGLYHLSIHAQLIKVPEAFTEAGMTVSAGRQTPFWLLANQYGLICPDPYNQWMRLRLKTGLTALHKIDYDYGIDVIGRHDHSGQLYLNQAYIRMKLYFLNVQAGKPEEKFGNQDSSLSSGGLLWSGNARPMPEISISVPAYTAVPFTRGFIEFRGGISHGWFGDNRFVNNSWLHHKYFYIQAGGRLPVHIHYGFHHFAQWGGVSADTAVGQMPHAFSDFIKVFYARQGGSDATLSEQLNALGNHLGSRNFGLDVGADRLKAGIYWQNLFEDGSGMHYRNIRDGLWGIYLHTREKGLLSGFVYEFIHTTDQSGKFDSYWLRNDSVYLYPVPGGLWQCAGGNDNYFNHGTYRYGWTYQGYTIGTPLITSREMLNKYNRESENILNNKIIAHHFAIEGSTRYLNYRVLFTYSLNSGTNSYPIKPAADQYSFLVNLQLHDKLPWRLIASMALALDRGELYGNNIGFRFSLSRAFGPN